MSFKNLPKRVKRPPRLSRQRKVVYASECVGEALFTVMSQQNAAGSMIHVRGTVKAARGTAERIARLLNEDNKIKAEDKAAHRLLAKKVEAL